MKERNVTAVHGCGNGILLQLVVVVVEVEIERLALSEEANLRDEMF